MATKKSGTRKGKGPGAAGIAAGALAAVAAAGATYYFFGAKNAKQHRRKAAKWATDMRNDVVREAKKLQELDDAVMHGIVDRVAGTYRAAKSVDAEEVMKAADELKRNWRRMEAEFRRSGRSAAKTARAAGRTAKKAAKKATKRGTKRPAKRGGRAR